MYVPGASLPRALLLTVFSILLFCRSRFRRILYLRTRPEARIGAEEGNSLGGLLQGAALGQAVQDQEAGLTSIGSDQEVVAPWYADQIPPFDVTLAAANEYGSLAVMRVYGIEILNEGYGVSIDDIVSETQSTYVARALQGWRRVEDASISTAFQASGPTSPAV